MHVEGQVVHVEGKVVHVLTAHKIPGKLIFLENLTVVQV